MEVKRRSLGIAAAVIAVAAMLVWWTTRQPPRRSAPQLPGVDQNASSAARLQRFLARKRPLSPFEAPLQWPASPLHPAAPGLSESSVEERKRYSDSLRAESAESLLQLWLSETQIGQDSLKLDFLADALVVRLREAGSDSGVAAAWMAEYAANPGNDLYLRWRMAQTLGEAATPNALRALLELAESAGGESNFEPLLLRQIARTGEVLWAGRFHEELSPILEQAWAKPEIDAELASAVANAMADVGTPAMVELLLRESFLAGPNRSEFEPRDSSRAWQAYQALEGVRNAESVPTLARYLNLGQPGDVPMLAAGQSLASMGRPEATAALLEWCRSTPADVAVLINAWMPLLRDPASIELATAAAASGVFANASNQQAFQDALALWNAHRGN